MDNQLNNQERLDVLKNPKPADYELSRIANIDQENLERQKKGAEDPKIAQEFVKNEILKKRLRDIGRKIFNLKGEIVDLKQRGGAEDEIISLKKEIAELVSQRNSILETKEISNYTAEEKAILDNAHFLLVSIRVSRAEAIKSFEGKAYVQRLMKEFGISEAEAKEHQRVRIENINNTEVTFSFLSDIQEDLPRAAGYFTTNTNKITIPVDYEDFALLPHEFRHAATNGNYGMSESAKKILSSETFKEKDSVDNEYFRDATERYVRLQALREKLVNLGIIKQSGHFDQKAYQKVIDLYKNHPADLDRGMIQLIEHTKDFDDPEKGYENFRQMFEELASNQSEENQGRDTYYHPGWNYDQPDNKA